MSQNRLERIKGLLFGFPLRELFSINLSELSQWCSEGSRVRDGFLKVIDYAEERRIASPQLAT